MSSKDANKENEGTASAKPAMNKNTLIYATDMTPEMRQTLIGIAEHAFNSPVNHGKVYQTIADLIRTECEKIFHDNAEKKKSGNENGGGEDGDKAVGSGGWSCVVGDAFGSSVTHRMKTYIHFSVVPNVNVLLWKS